MNKLNDYENLPTFSKIFHKPKSGKQVNRKFRSNRSALRSAKRNQS